MEHHISFFAIFLIFFSLIFMLIKQVNKPKPKPKPKNLPPSPWKLPIIGNLHHLALAATNSLPHHTLTQLAKKHGPLMHLKLGEVSTIVISSPQMAKKVLKDHETNFSNRPYLLAAKILSYDSTSIVSARYGNYLMQLRKIYMTELLSPSRVKSFHYIREEEISSLVGAISSSEGSTINLSEMIYSLTSSVTSRVAFGNKWRDNGRLNSIVARGAALTTGLSVSDMYPSIKWLEVISGLRPKVEKLHQEIDQILEDIIKKHRENGIGEEADQENRDLVDILLGLQARRDLEYSVTDNNIKGVLVGIIAAGSETSSAVIEWAMAEMLKNPSLMMKVQAEVRRNLYENDIANESNFNNMKIFKAMIKETMRLHPSTPLLFPRECVEDCMINGYDIPTKTKVIVNAWAIGRDPDYWDDPKRFYPERFLNRSIDYKGAHFQFIPFGSGRRICPGIGYAISNIELPLAKLLYHFNWKLANEMSPEDLDMNESFGATMRRKENLFVIPSLYRPLSTK